MAQTMRRVIQERGPRAALFRYPFNLAFLAQETTFSAQNMNFQQ